MDAVDQVQLNFNPAIIAAWWGVWHLISGLTPATYWSRHPVPIPEAT
ncbi:MAG: hypothetical protein JRF42_07425 [Deltaproteobacteria bacterium]|nr:hypothetical protein [Deltaproteobacteria bacterium]MBW2547448.1 hypothetical protein [Deltaproteobacteria bacterium]